MTTPLVLGCAYYRVSSTQNEDSIPQQREWAQQACPAEGIEIVAEFEDAARTGTEAAKRHAFQDMLKLCQQRHKERRPIRVLVVWHTNRFSRADSLETASYLHAFREAGVERMFTAKGWIDFSKAEHRVLFGIGQDLSNHAFSRDQAQASLRGRIQNAANGKWNGGPCPFGLLVQRVPKRVRDAKGREKERLVPEKLLPHPEHAPWLVWIFEHYASGTLSLWQLAKSLNTQGIKPPGKAKLWNPTTLLKILGNDLYLGTAVWNRRRTGRFFCAVNLTPTERTERTRSAERNPEKDHIRGAQPLLDEPLVPLALFETVQKRLRQRQKKTTPRHEHDFRLTGLLRCGHCGGRMVGRHKPLRGKDANGACLKLFLCGNYARHGLQGCHHNAIYEGSLFDALVKKVRDCFLNPETLDRLREAIRRRVAAVPSAVERERCRLTEKLADLEAMVSKAAARLITEDDPRILKACREELKKLVDEQERAERDLRILPSDDPAQSPEQLVEEAVALMRRFEDVLAKDEPAAVRALLADMIEKVEVFFEHTQGSRGIECRFAKALVYLREEVSGASCFLTTSTHGQQLGKYSLTLLPQDLAA